MDTYASSPNRPSLAPRLFGVALTVGVGFWLAIIGADLAHAQTAPQTAKVSYADLDLSTPGGAKALLTRIRVAAGSACGKENHSPLFPRAMAQHRTCVTDAVNAAVGRVDAPLVAAIHTDALAGASYASR
jgi:UrcA family protein